MTPGFDDFNPNQYLAQLGANWSNQIGIDSVEESNKSGTSAEHTITWSSSSSWKPKQNEQGEPQSNAVQETSINGGADSLISPPPSILDSSQQQKKPPNRIMPPLPKDLQKKTSNEETSSSTSATESNNGDWTVKKQSQNSVVYYDNQSADSGAIDYSYYEYGGYDDSQYYDYESYNSGYYDQYGNWVQQNQPTYHKHDLMDAQNDYENIVEKGRLDEQSKSGGGASASLGQYEQSCLDVPRGVISERTEDYNSSSTSIREEPLYENTEIMYPMANQDGSDTYSQELMDMMNYPTADQVDHYSSGEEESSDVELIEEGSMGRYSTFSNLSTAKEKKSKENRDQNEDNSNHAASGGVTEEDALDVDSNNFVQYQQEQEISAALAKAGRHPRTPLCTLIESSEEEEDVSDYGMGRSKKKVLDIPKRPTRTEMLQKLEVIQAGIEQKTTVDNQQQQHHKMQKFQQKYPMNVQQQARSNQIITVEAPKMPAPVNVHANDAGRVPASTQTMPKSALKASGSNIIPSMSTTVSNMAVPPPPVTTSGQTSLYYRLAKDMISEHYNVGKSTHSQSLATRLEIGQTPLENVNAVANKALADASRLYQTSNTNTIGHEDKSTLNLYKCTTSTQTQTGSVSETSQTNSAQMKDASKGNRSVETQSGLNGNDSGVNSNGNVKEKRVKFLEKRTWSLPETEEDLEVGSRSLAVNVERVLISSSDSTEDFKENEDSDIKKTSKSTSTRNDRDLTSSSKVPLVPPSRVSTAIGTADKSTKKSGAKRILPQPDPEEVEEEENSTRFGGRIKARPLRHDEVDILKKRLLTPSGKDRKYQQPLQSILKKEVPSPRSSSEVKGRRLTSTSVQADSNADLVDDFTSDVRKVLNSTSEDFLSPEFNRFKKKSSSQTIPERKLQSSRKASEVRRIDS